MKLEQLKAVGAMAASMEAVSMVGVNAKSIDEVLALPKSAQGELQCVVTVRNPVWVATARRKPPQEATTVYSCDSNGMIGCWKRKDRTFLLSVVREDRLMTKKIFNLMEDKQMAKGLDVNAMSQSMNEFEDLLNEGAAAPAPSPAQPAGDGKPKSKAQQTKEKIEKVRTSLSSYAIGNTDDAVMQNRKYGKLIGFITKTNNVLKLSRKSRLKLDANKKRIAKSDVPQDVLDKYNKVEAGKTPKPLPARYCETEVELAFTDAKPGAIVGVVLATPAGSEVALTKLQNTEIFTADDKNLDLVHRIIPIEAAYQYVSANYGSGTDTWIKEDPSVVGPTAGKVYLKYTYSEKKDDETGEMKSKVRAAFALKRNEAKRKTLLTANNYFPLKVYQTKPLAGASAEDATMFNYNVSAALKKEGAYESLCEASKSLLTLKDDGEFESQWFNHGGKVVAKKFDASDDSEVITDVKIPVREKAVSDKTGKVSYKFKYIKIGEENGPETIPVFKNIIQKSGFETEEFLKKAGELDARKSSSGSSAKASFTATDFLKAQFSHTIDTGVSKSLLDIASEIEASAAAM